MLAVLACQGKPPPLTPMEGEKRTSNTTKLSPEVERAIWRVRGSDVIDGRGELVTMQGIGFGNEVWDHVPIPSAHHTGQDYQVVKSMGMNVVRFYLSYHTFESDGAPLEYKPSGWDWLDQNVEWAKKAGVRLIFNMHDPVGGFQPQGEGESLWTDEERQRRFIELWRAIAERYRAEPAVAGFGLLNEPLPPQGPEQWKDLAERTISAIRQVDQHHMIFVERTHLSEETEVEQERFFKVNDPNVVYEFHFYEPFHYTHQNASWLSSVAREGWYPDESIPEVESSRLKLVARTESETLPAGASEWTLIETKPYVVEDPKIVVGKPFLFCDSAQGRITFDTLSLTRVDDVKGGAREPQVQFELDLDTLRGWEFWQEEGGGRAFFSSIGHGDKTALSIEKTRGPAHLGSDPLRFFVKQGSEYTLQVLVRGEHLGKDSRCGLRLEFYSASSPVLARGQSYLEQALVSDSAWGKEQGVPLFVGEIGTIRESFLPGRGGLKWVSDMLDLLKEHDLHFSYHAYHETPYGLFLGEGFLPSQYGLHRPLYDLIVQHLHGSGRLPWEPTATAPAKTVEKNEEAKEEADPSEQDGVGEGETVVIEEWD